MELNLLGKRKKKQNPDPNPLFCEWLTEWKNDAAAKGQKSQHTYSKALYSLKKYPLPISSGKECKFLENFGDKICSMLDERLSKHIATHGPIDSSSPEADSEEDEDDLPSVLRVPVPPVRSKKYGAVSVGNTKTKSHCFSLDSGSEDDEVCKAAAPILQCQRNKRGSGREKEYIPKQRSGPYAILLTLYRDQQRPTSRGYMSKQELMREAQPLADKSFTIPDPGCRYTAWSSMGSLINKGLVLKHSSPARYSITDKGCELADKIVCSEQNQDYCSARSDELQFTIGDGPGPVSNESHGTFGNRNNNRFSVESDSDSDHDCVKAMLSVAQTEISDVPDSYCASSRTQGAGRTRRELPNLEEDFNTGSGDFQFWYVSDGGDHEISKDKAAVHITDELGVGFLVKCSYDSLLMSGKRYTLDTTRSSSDDQVFAFLHNDDAPEFAHLPCGNSQQNLPSNSSKSAEGKPTSEAPKLVAQTAKKSKSSAKTTKDPSPFSSSSSSSVAPTSFSQQLPKGEVFSAFIRTASSDSQQSTASSDVRSLSGIESQDSQSILAEIEVDYVLRPHNFNIILCVDNCEMFGGGSSASKETLIKELRKNAVSFEVRKLQVGDFLWVARDNSGSGPRELVLDYVVERKRMDDLASSIMDGRFREQKFRLKNCGVQHPIYLVEDYGSTQNLSIPEDTLLQAITNTQIIDGFYVKRTHDIRESAAYLTLMTRHLQSIYMSKTLHACSKQSVQDLHKHLKPGVHDNEAKLINFQEFNQSAVKNRPLTVKEMFGKQLVQMHSLTAEKTAAILEKYPTPTSLMEAYNSCNNNKEKESLLSVLKFGMMKRSFGAHLSKQISLLYTTRGCLS